MNDVTLKEEYRNLPKNFDPDSEAYKKRQIELNCIEMINSILAYEWVSQKETAEEILQKQEENYHNYLQKYTNKLGKDRVIRLIQEQMDDIETIITDVHTDYEGCSYNSIQWKRDSL